VQFLLPTEYNDLLGGNYAAKLDAAAAAAQPGAAAAELLELKAAMHAASQADAGPDAAAALTAVRNRLVAAELAKDLIFPADEELTERCTENSQALIYALIKQPLAGNVDDITPESVKLASFETIAERDELKKLFNNSYVVEPEGKVSTVDLLATLELLPGNNSSKLLASRMATWGFGRPRNVRFEPGPKGVRAGYEGIATKYDADKLARARLRAQEAAERKRKREAGEDEGKEG
jgi:hypothetical protein